MGDMTKNFSRSEFSCKGTSCCGGASPINPSLVACLQALRDLISELYPFIDPSLHVNSGFRCITHNNTVPNHDPNSYHTLGLAADIACPYGIGIKDFRECAEQIPAFNRGGIGTYPTGNFLHLDIRPNGPTRWTE